MGYDLKLTPSLGLSAAVRQQYFAYDRFDELDFGSLNFGLGLAYTVHRLDDVILSAQFGFTRLTRRGVWDNEFFRDGSLDLSAQKLWTFGRAQLLGVGGDIALNVSVPHVAEREEFGFSVGYVFQLTRNLSAQTGWRLAYYLYAATARGLQCHGQRGADVRVYAVVQRGGIGVGHAGPLRPRGVRLRRAQYRGQRVLPAQVLTAFAVFPSVCRCPFFPSFLKL